MIKLPSTWEGIIIWLVIGCDLFTYSIKHSKVQAMSPQNHRRTANSGAPKARLYSCRKTNFFEGTGFSPYFRVQFKWL